MHEKWIKAAIDGLSLCINKACCLNRYTTWELWFIQNSLFPDSLVSQFTAHVCISLSEYVCVCVCTPACNLYCERPQVSDR